MKRIMPKHNNLVIITLSESAQIPTRGQCYSMNASPVNCMRNTVDR